MPTSFSSCTLVKVFLSGSMTAVDTQKYVITPDPPLLNTQFIDFYSIEIYYTRLFLISRNIPKNRRNVPIFSKGRKRWEMYYRMILQYIFRDGSRRLLRSILLGQASVGFFEAGAKIRGGIKSGEIQDIGNVV
jgi:hypothetical protein